MESDENTSRLETPSDVFTRLRGLVISELGVLGSLSSSFQDGVRSGSRQPNPGGWMGWVWNPVWPMAGTARTCGRPRKTGSFSAGAPKQARWKGGQGSHPEGSQGASMHTTQMAP